MRKGKWEEGCSMKGDGAEIHMNSVDEIPPSPTILRSHGISHYLDKILVNE